jgi:hypothetical protein
VPGRPRNERCHEMLLLTIDTDATLPSARRIETLT